MPRMVNWDGVPDSNILDPGIYTFELEALDETATRSGAKLMYKAAYRVTDGPFEGMLTYDNFTIGTADDPTADKHETWAKSIGAKRMKGLFKAAQVPQNPDLDVMIQTALGQRFSATVTQKEDDGSRDPKYKGTLRNEIARFYPVGVRPSDVAAPRAAGGPAGAVPTVRCPDCGDEMPRSEFVRHQQEKHPE